LSERIRGKNKEEQSKERKRKGEKKEKIYTA
jgi:hypothetical protein